MSHVFVKTYSCHFCEELFTSEVSVRTTTSSLHFSANDHPWTNILQVMTHERIHTGIIKFECKICDFRCNRYIQMENHKKVSENGLPKVKMQSLETYFQEDHGYLCSICQESFGEWAEIKNHTLSKHGGYLTSDTYTGIKGIFIVLAKYAAKALHYTLPPIDYSKKVAKKDFSTISPLGNAKWVLDFSSIVSLWLSDNFSFSFVLFTSWNRIWRTFGSSISKEDCRPEMQKKSFTCDLHISISRNCQFLRVWDNKEYCIRSCDYVV